MFTVASGEFIYYLVFLSALTAPYGNAVANCEYSYDELCIVQKEGGRGKEPMQYTTNEERHDTLSRNGQDEKGHCVVELERRIQGIGSR